MSIRARFVWATCKSAACQIHVPTGVGTFQGDFDFTQTKGFILRVSAGMDLDTNTATWLLQAIDPTTGEVLQRCHPGLAAAAGATGFVTYTVQPMKGLATGSQISADAQVLFNNAPPQDTGAITQTIDGTAPTTTLTRHAAFPRQRECPGELERRGRSRRLWGARA